MELVCFVEGWTFRGRASNKTVNNTTNKHNISVFAGLIKIIYLLINYWVSVNVFINKWFLN